MTDAERPILVTGADGALGQRLVSTLKHAGVRVASLGRRNDPAEPGNERITADITDAEPVRRGLQHLSPRVVIHLAAMRGPACADSPAAAIATNVTATAALAQAAADAGVERFVFASSGAVYGDRYSRAASETDLLQGESIYALTKIEAEEELGAISRDSGMEVVALRIFNIYGDAFASSLVTRLMGSSPDSAVTLHGLDEFVRDYIHVDDVVRACDNAASRPLPNKVVAINVGSGQAVSNARLIDIVSARSEPTFVVAPGSPSYSVANVTRMRELLGFVGSPLSEWL